LEEIKSKPSGDIAEHPKFKEVNTALEASNKRVESLENDLKFAAYQKHPDYEAQFQKPYEAAFQAARTAMTQLDVAGDDGNTRPGTAEDFDKLWAVSDSRQQRAAAKALFGDDSYAMAQFLLHRDKVADIAEKARTAVDDFQKKAGERDKQRADGMAKHQQRRGAEITQVWQKKVAELTGPTSKQARWFTPVEGDDEGNALLEAGNEKAKKAFSNLNLYDPRLKSEQVAEHTAGQCEIITKGGGFDRQELLYDRMYKDLSAQLKAAKDELKQFKASEPGAGDGNRAKATGPLTVKDEITAKLRKLVR
jgi:hypothetical protein